MLVEPPGPQLLAGRTSTDRLRLAAAAAALVLAATSSGEVVALAVLLGVVAGDVFAFAACLLGAMAVVARWGTGSLPALAGGQAVAGAAGLFGSGAAVGSAWYAGAAFVLASPGGWLAVPFGVAAGAVVAGPAVLSLATAGERLAAAVVGVGVAVLLPRFVPRRLAVRVGAALGLLAAVLAAGR